MSRNSLIADSITRIRNAQAVGKPFVIVEYSGFISNCLRVLQELGYISHFEEFEEKKGVRMLKVDLKYYRNKKVISEIRIVSKPGHKVYVQKEKLPSSKNGLGTYIISTSQGVMDDKSARNLGLGGEIVLEVN